MTQIAFELAAALATLDPANDDHWTADGQARVDVVSASLQQFDLPSVTRQDIIDGAPTFTRTTAPELLAAYRETAGVLDPTAAAAAHEAPAPPSADPVAQVAPSPPVLPVADTRPQAPPEVKPVLASVQTSSAAPRAAQRACDMPVAEIANSIELLERAITELNDESQELLREKSRIDRKMKSLYTKSEACMHRLRQIKPKEDPMAGVQGYLKGQARIREQRARRAQSFINSGTTAKDVADQLQGASKLDAAMAQRKAAPGSTRPSLVPVGQDGS